ncbi:MAG: hypothetical protein JWM11_7220 [Planctomycetaceae bacterium]|nr:hypothetical protein [Planctomycetaceae bacterium]
MVLLVDADVYSAADDFPAVQHDFGWDEEVDQITGPLTPGDLKRRCLIESTILRSLYGRESEEAGVERLYHLLKNETISAQRVYDFDAETCRKLELAGRGDIKRFVEHVQALRKRYFEKDPFVDRGAQRILSTELLELREQTNLEVLFGPSSLYGKTLKKALVRTNLKRYAERDVYDAKLMLSLVLSALESEHPLRTEQRDPLLEVLQQRLKNSPAALFRYREELLTLLREIPTSEYEPILVGKQIQSLRSKLEAVRKQN